MISNTAGRLAQKQPSFKECVTAHQNIPAARQDGNLAPKMIGAKESTEDGNPAFGGVVEERPVMHWSFDVSQGGVYRSENADISSDSPDENSGYRKPKVSEATSIGFGSVDTNPVPKWCRGCPNR